MENKKEKITIPVEDTNEISDGYHTFGELYEHRITLFIALCNSLVNEKRIFQNDREVECTEEEAGIKDVWRSKKHSDGEPAFGGTWFVLGIGKEKGKQITYHLPIEKWEETNFAEDLNKAPEFDGHKAQDVLNRLANL